MPLPIGAGPHVLVDDVDDPVLDDDDAHHLARVLRVAHGEPFTVGDGAGAWRRMRFGEGPGGPVHREPSVDAPVTVCFAILKGGRTELVVQKLTEIGVDVIVPMTTDRTIARWDRPKARAQHERLGRVAREATMQCRRAWLPEIAPLERFEEAAARPGAVLADVGAAAPPDAATVLIGPEGGWSDAERDQLARVGLGDTVLRAETAAMVAATLLVHTRLAPRSG